METATPTANGSATGERTLDQIRERASREMEELLAPLAARRAQLESELAGVLKEEEEIKTTMLALTGKPAPKQRKPSTNPGTHGTSQKVRDDIYAILATTTQPDMITPEIVSAAGLSPSVVMEAIRSLRAEERIRLVGKRRREGDPRPGGRPNQAYAVMPRD